jgi:hypothetical protein
VSEQITGLSRQERSRLLALEETIARGRRLVQEVLEALFEVRDRRLYREQYPTFEAYCKEKWHWTPQYVNMQLACEETRRSLESAVSAVDAADRALRPLNRLAPEDKAEAYRMASELAEGGKVTSAETLTTSQLILEARSAMSEEGRARLGEMEAAARAREEARRKHALLLADRSELKRQKDAATAVERLRHALKALRRLGWDDLAAELNMLSGRVERRRSEMARAS